MRGQRSTAVSDLLLQLASTPSYEETKGAQKTTKAGIDHAILSWNASRAARFRRPFYPTSDASSSMVPALEVLLDFAVSFSAFWVVSFFFCIRHAFSSTGEYISALTSGLQNRGFVRPPRACSPREAVSLKRRKGGDERNKSGQKDKGGGGSPI